MRNLVFAFLLFLGIARPPLLPANSQSVSHSVPESLPYWLVVDVFEAACAESEHFSDIGVEELVTRYYHASATIEYLGKDAVNPAMGMYRAAADGGIIVVIITDDF